MTALSQIQRVYIIGAGAVAGFHMRAMQAMQDGFEWEWNACDVRPEALEKLKAEFPSVHPYSDSAAMLAQEARPTDIVIVCAPTFLHAALARRALSSGRHVLCEKPLFLSLAEADEIGRQLAGAKGLLLACCSNRFIGRASVARTRDLIAGGRIGALYRVRWVERKNRSRSGIEYQPGSRWFLNREQNGGGIAMDFSPYDIAVLDAILRPKRVTVASCLMEQVETGVPLEPGTVFDVETQVVAQMNYELADNTIIRVDYERASATHGREESVFELEGKRGAIDLEWAFGDKVRLSYDREGAVVTEVIPIEPETMGFHERPIQDMIRAVRGKPSLAIINEDALFNFRCLRALYEAHERGCPVTVERLCLRGGVQ